MLQVLQQHKILHLPLVDQDQRVVALVTLDEFVPTDEEPLMAVIMAGGLGVRLRPLTDELPKPMLPVGDRPLMEIIVRQLRASGIRHVNVTVHHKPEKITEHFGDGREFGVKITYLTEDRPLGTAGALGMMEPPQETVLVINGDILTQVDFRTMLTYHHEHHADLTVAVQQHDLQVPYGVIQCEGTFVRHLAEKPTLKFLVNAGIYLLEPIVYSFIPTGERYDMTDLIQRLLNEGRQVVAFPIREYWMDIGQNADYQQVKEHARDWEPSP
jgi:NDP-sugar pyrophosphorylase family protein